MFIDISVKLDDNSPVIKWANKQDNPYLAMGHVGTHIDVYEKTNIPLEYLKSNGIIFNVTDIKEVGVNDIDLDQVHENDTIIFRTSHLRKYGYGTDDYFKDHPQLSTELIDALIEKKVRFIGIDAPGIRKGEEHEVYDRKCEKNNVYVIENISSLHLVTSPHCTIYTMWMDDNIKTGLRCRVIAEVADN